jgi:hypothetical protein
MKFTLTGSIINGDKVYDNKAMYFHALQKLEGKRNNRFIETLERLSEKRTDQQNKWLWAGIYTPIHAALYNLGNDHLNVEDIHEMMLEMFAPRIDTVNPQTSEILHGKIIRSSDMDKEQFSAYCEQIRKWAAEFLGIDIINPDEFILQK